MEWEKVLRNSVQNGAIKEAYLAKIPQLRNCDNWKNVKPLGWIDHEMTFSHYKGMLVTLQKRIFFVSEKTINALSGFISWKSKGRIKVLPD